MIFSFTIILRAIANSSDNKENLLDDNDLRFSIQLFSCWDFKIANRETADNKIASIATAFRETILEEEESGKSQEQNIWSTRCLRPGLQKYHISRIRTRFRICIRIRRFLQKSNTPKSKIPKKKNFLKIYNKFFFESRCAYPYPYPYTGIQRILDT